MSTIERSDADIRQDILETLRGVGLPLEVSVNDGVVTLEGVVLSEEEREAAVDLLQFVAGVSEVRDDLELMETDIERPMVLFGSLTQPDAWDPAASDADDDWTTDERTAVQDGLTYMPPTDPPVDLSEGRDGIEVASGFQSSSMDDDDEMLSYSDGDEVPEVRDGEITDNVVRELNEDASTTHLNIHVASVRGTVYLTGYVSDPNDGDNAAAVAERVPGVQEVVDRLVVGERPQAVQRMPGLRGRKRPEGKVAMPGPAWRTTVARNERWLERELLKTEEKIADRREELATIGRDQAAEGSISNHQGDIASDVVTAETLNTEIVHLQDEVETIRELQQLMTQGRYGICRDCRQYIDPARLRAFPLAMRCIDCQQRFEDQSAPSMQSGHRRGIG